MFEAGIHLSPYEEALNKAVHVCGDVMEKRSLFVQEQINILSRKRMMEAEARNHGILLFTVSSFLLKTKLTSWSLYISQLGLPHSLTTKSLFQGLVECFSLARLLWVCSSPVSPKQASSRSFLIGCESLLCAGLLFKIFSTLVIRTLQQPPTIFRV